MVKVQGISNNMIRGRGLALGSQLKTHSSDQPCTLCTPCIHHTLTPCIHHTLCHVPYTLCHKPPPSTLYPVPYMVRLEPPED